MSTARVRPARWDDRGSIVELMEAMGGHDGAHDRPGTWPNLARTLRDPAIRVLVAEVGGAVLGWIEVQRRISPIHGRSEAWIQSLCVAPEARGRRIGQELIEAAVRAAAEFGVDVLTVDTSVHREDTHRFYYANGFEDETQARRLRRPLVGPTTSGLAGRFLAAAAAADRAVGDTLARLDGERDGLAPASVDNKYYDLTAEAAALAALEPLGLTILTEERGAVGRLPGPGEPWIALDPIDGTRNYLAGMPPWGISIGLVVDGRPLAGWVGDLANGRAWSAVAGEGAFADGRRIATRETGMLLLPSTAPIAVPTLDDRFERLRVVGSTAISLCYVAEGAAGAFLDFHRDICAVWELAAAAVIVAEAGGAIVDPAGEEPSLGFDPEQRFDICAAHDLATAEATAAGARTLQRAA